MTRIRSPGYPSIALAEAIDLTGKIFEHNRRNPTDREAAVKDMGFSGITGHSQKMLSNLAHFGLIEKAGKGGVGVSELAVRILHPKNSEERKVALQEAAFSPELFQEIRTNWPDGFVSENSLRAYLMREGFASVAVAPAIKSYQDTYGFLRQEGATESHGGQAVGDAESAMKVDDVGPPLKIVQLSANSASRSGGATVLSALYSREGAAPMDGERIVFVEESNPSQYLKLIARGELDESLLEALEDYVKRQKKRLFLKAAGAGEAGD